MEQYLRKSTLAGLLNCMGVRVVLMICGIGWFVWLWGVSVPSLLAGCALGILLVMAVNRLRAHAADDRGETIRRQIGGEMALENLVMMPPAQVHRQAAQWLQMRYPLVVQSVDEHGARCQYDHETLLIQCTARPGACEIGCMDAVALQRACHACHADRGVLCLTGKPDKRLTAYVENSEVPIRLISRETMLMLAGQASPATDEQLLALKQRKERRAAAHGAMKVLLHPSKAKRYMGYGMGLMLMYILTGVRWYPIPGALCMGMAVLCRCSRHAAERL